MFGFSNKATEIVSKRYHQITNGKKFMYNYPEGYGDHWSEFKNIAISISFISAISEMLFICLISI